MFSVADRKSNFKQCFFLFPAKLGKKKRLCIEVFTCIGFGGFSHIIFATAQLGRSFDLSSASKHLHKWACEGFTTTTTKHRVPYTNANTSNRPKRALVPYGRSRTRTRRGLRGPSHAPHTHTDLNNHSDGTLTHNFHIHSLCC